MTAELVTHFGDESLLPIHPTPAGEGVGVAFNRETVTCKQCLDLLAALDDRRKRAREAFWDRLGPPPIRPNGEGGASESLDEAIETATRVQITPEIVTAAYAGKSMTDTIIAAFRAAGFEVTE